MFLARVIGQVVSTKKEADMKGHRLLLVRPMLVDPDDPTRFRPGGNTIVTIDPLGAGQGEMVMLVQGSSARQCSGLKSIPVDAAIVGIVDSVNVLGKQIFHAANDTPDAS
jgi:ethanolamine utilization protein EutN